MDQEKRQQKLAEIIKENMQIKADITTVIAIFTEGFKGLGLTPEDFSGQKDIMGIVGKIIPRLTGQMATGSLNGEAFAKFHELQPIIKRYEHLAPAEIKQ